MMIQSFLPLLNGVRPVHTQRNTWLARCPGHDDRSPSLLVSWDEVKLKILVHCYARCTTDTIVNSLGLKMADLFGDNRVARPLTGGGEEKNTRIVDEYPYHDEEGKLLYTVCRFEPKGFAQRRPDSRAKSGYTWGLGETRRVLYHLPEIVKRADDTVLVVEGEKAADYLTGMGLLATTNPGGCGMGWRDEYSRSLAGRRVVVFPDHDDNGYERADLIVGSLIRHGVGSVQLVTLPGVKDGGGVDDWLESNLRDNLKPIEVLRELVTRHERWSAVGG